jgi:hypothetical protein
LKFPRRSRSKTTQFSTVYRGGTPTAAAQLPRTILTLAHPTIPATLAPTPAGVIGALEIKLVTPLARFTDVSAAPIASHPPRRVPHPTTLAPLMRLAPTVPDYRITCVTGVHMIMPVMPLQVSMAV